jgi:hypothetical protein
MFATQFEMSAASRLLEDWGFGAQHRDHLVRLLAIAPVPYSGQTVDVPVRQFLDSFRWPAPAIGDVHIVMHMGLKPSTIVIGKTLVALSALSEYQLDSDMTTLSFAVSKAFVDLVRQHGRELAFESSVEH